MLGAAQRGVPWNPRNHPESATVPGYKRSDIQLLPHVVVMKIMSDLCCICQQNSTAIARSANRPEEKTQVHSIAIATSIGTHMRIMTCDNGGERKLSNRERERERERGREGGREREGGCN